MNFAFSFDAPQRGSLMAAPMGFLALPRKHELTWARIAAVKSTEKPLKDLPDELPEFPELHSCPATPCLPLDIVEEIEEIEEEAAKSWPIAPTEKPKRMRSPMWSQGIQEHKEAFQKELQRRRACFAQLKEDRLSITSASSSPWVKSISSFNSTS